MTDKRKLQPSEVTDHIISKWKEEYGKVFKYTTTDGKVGFFKMPDRKLMDASSAYGKDHPVLSNEMLAKGCFLAGDEELISEDSYFYGLSSWLKNLISVKEGELKEL